MSKEISKVPSLSIVNENAVCPSCFSFYTYKMENLDKKIARRIPGCNHYMCEPCIIADGTNTGQVHCRHYQCSARILWNNNIDTFPVATVAANHPVADVTTNHHVSAVATNPPVATMATNHSVASVANNHVATAATNHPVATVATNHPVEDVTTNHPVATMATNHPVATVANNHVATAATNHPVATVTINHPVATAATNHPVATEANNHVATAATNYPVETVAINHPVVTNQRDLPPPKTDDDFMREGEKLGLLCGECDVEIANCFCKSCDVNLCSQCFDTIHSNSKSLRRHKATPLDTRNLRMDNCGVDAEIMHHVTDDSQIGWYNEKARNNLQDKVVFGRSTLLRLKDLESKLKSESIEGIGKSSEDLKEAIQSHFSACQTELQSFEHQLYKELETQNMKAVSSLLNVAENTATRIKQIGEAISIAEDALLHSSKSTQDNFNEILERLSHLDNEPCVLMTKGRTASDIFQINFPFVDLLKKHVTMNYADNFEVKVLPLNQVPLDYEVPASLQEKILTGSSSSIPVNSTTSNLATDLKLNQDNHLQVNSFSQDTIEQKAKHNVGDDHQDTMEQIVNRNVNDDRHDTMEPKVNHDLVSDDESKRANNLSSVIISHIVNPGKFFIQRTADFNKVIKMNESLKESTISNGRNGSLKVEEVGRGDLVIARYEPTREMYRANVISISKVNQTYQYNVQFIDYGFCATVELSDLRKATPRQLRTPPLATECSLSGISPRELTNSWSQECIEAFKDLTLNKSLQMFEIKRVGVVHEVDLCLQSSDELLGDLTSVNDSLIYRKLARLASHPAYRFPEPEHRHFRTLNLLEKGKSFKVMVSDVVDPGEFSVQVVAIGEDRSWGRCVEKLFDDLQENYNTARGDCLWSVYAPKVGTVCVAKYSLDGFYYRATVVRLLEARVVEVNFVDFGNNEITDWSKLRTLFNTFLEIPKLSVKVSLADIEPLSSSYSQESIEAFSQMTYAKEMLMYVEEVEENDVPTKVALYETMEDKDVCVNAWMVEKKLAKSTNGLYTVEYLKEASDREIKDKGQPEPKMKSLSERARELKNQDERVRALDEERLDDSKDTVKSDLSCDFKNGGLVEAKKPLDQSHETKCIASAPIKDKRKGGFYRVTEVVSPARILVCNINDIKRISRLNCDLSLALLQHRSESSSRAVGSYCAARLDSKTWGRAKIIRLNQSNSATIFFYDTGNTQEVSIKELKDLPENFNEVPPFAKQVHLSDVRPSTGDAKWSDDVCEKLKELLLVEDVVTVLDDGEVVLEANLEMTSQPVQILIWESVEKGPLEPLEWKEFSVSEKLVNLKLAVLAKNPGPGKEALCVQENLGSHILESTERSFEDISTERIVKEDHEDKKIAPSCRLLGESLASVADISKLSSLDTESKFQGIMNKSTANENESIAELEKEIFPFPKVRIPYTVGEEFPVTFLGQLSQDLIYCHLVPDQKYPCLHQNAHQFRKLMEVLQAAGGHQPVVTEPRAGLPVIARYTIDRKWYRAVVTCELPLTVLFVDFGNSQQLEEVRSLPGGLEMIPEQAILLKFVSAPKTGQQEVISPEGLIGCRLVQLAASTSAGKPLATVELMSWSPEDSSDGLNKATVVKIFQRQNNAQ